MCFERSRQSEVGEEWPFHAVTSGRIPEAQDPNCEGFRLDLRVHTEENLEDLSLLPENRNMLWTICVILLVLWALGLATSYTMGGMIHLP